MCDTQRERVALRRTQYYDKLEARDKLTHRRLILMPARQNTWQAVRPEQRQRGLTDYVRHITLRNVSHHVQAGNGNTNEYRRLTPTANHMASKASTIAIDHHMTVGREWLIAL